MLIFPLMWRDRKRGKKRKINNSSRGLGVRLLGRDTCLENQ